MSDMDYANYDQPDWMQEPEQKSCLVPILFSLVAGIGIGFGANYFLSQQQNQPSTSKLEREVSFLQQKLDRAESETERLHGKILQLEEEKTATTQVEELTFYSKLPNKDVTPEPLPETEVARPDAASVAAGTGLPLHVEEAIPAVAEKTAAKAVPQQSDEEAMAPITSASQVESAAQRATTSTYRIQVSSYKELAQAQSFAPRLHKIGLETQVQEIQIPKLGVRYRVYVIGLGDAKAAEQAKSLIKKRLKIDSIIVKGH